MDNNLATFPVRTWQLCWYVLIAVSGIIGNSIIIYLAFVSKKGGINRKAPFNIYLIALAITDLLACICCVPVYLLSTSAIKHQESDLMCKIVTGYFLPFWFLDASVFLLSALAIERWRVIVKPFAKLTKPKVRFVLLGIVGIFLLSVMTQSPVIYGEYYVPSGGEIGNWCKFVHRGVFAKILHYNSLFFKTVVPCGIFIYCFWTIRKTLSVRSARLRAQMSVKGITQREQQQQAFLLRRTKQTINTMRLVVIAFLLCVAINEIAFLLLKSVIGITELEWNSPAYQFTVLLRYTNSCINPVLYGFKSKIFRTRLKESFRCTGGVIPTENGAVHFNNSNKSVAMKGGNARDRKMHYNSSKKTVSMKSERSLSVFFVETPSSKDSVFDSRID